MHGGGKQLTEESQAIDDHGRPQTRRAQDFEHQAKVPGADGDRDRNRRLNRRDQFGPDVSV
jgi:hypothetical protein